MNSSLKYLMVKKKKKFYLNCNTVVSVMVVFRWWLNIIFLPCFIYQPTIIDMQSALTIFSIWWQTSTSGYSTMVDSLDCNKMLGFSQISLDKINQLRVDNYKKHMVLDSAYIIIEAARIHKPLSWVDSPRLNNQIEVHSMRVP